MTEKKLEAKLLRRMADVIEGAQKRGCAAEDALRKAADELDPPQIETWCGRRIDDMTLPELRAALRQVCQMNSSFIGGKNR
jgi:hypothetical protein